MILDRLSIWEWTERPSTLLARVPRRHWLDPSDRQHQSAQVIRARLTLTLSTLSGLRTSGELARGTVLDGAGYIFRIV